MHASTRKDGCSKKRMAPVRCAAANDDEDLDGLFDVITDKKKPRKASPDRAASSAASSGGAKKKKEKEFAWMDSDEDEDKVEDDGGDKGSDEEDKMEISCETLDEVQSFGRMMKLLPSLQKQIEEEKLSPAEISAACRAIGRTKFFDGDVNERLKLQIRKLIMVDKFDMNQLDDIVQCFGCLNAYDRATFTAIAKGTKAKTPLMPGAMRVAWEKIFKMFKHTDDEDFLQMLEVPPVPPMHPNYKKVRCVHFSRGACAIGSSCTLSHDPRAPLTLVGGENEDKWRARQTVMTNNQRTLGRGTYGDTKVPVAPMAAMNWNLINQTITLPASQIITLTPVNSSAAMPSNLPLAFQNMAQFNLAQQAAQQAAQQDAFNLAPS